MPGGTSDLIVASSLNVDDGESGTSAAAFVDPVADRLLAPVPLTVDVNIGVILDDSVFFAGERGPHPVVVDRGTWTVTATPDVLVVDARTVAVTDTVKPLGVLRLRSSTVACGSHSTISSSGLDRSGQVVGATPARAWRMAAVASSAGRNASRCSSANVTSVAVENDVRVLMR